MVRKMQAEGRPSAGRGGSRDGRWEDGVAAATAVDLRMVWRRRRWTGGWCGGGSGCGPDDGGGGGEAQDWIGDREDSGDYD